MNRRLRACLTRCALASGAFLGALTNAHAQTPRVLDAFDGAPAWKAFPSDGVRLDIGREARGVSGSAMSMAFDFQGRAGYAIARGAIALGTPGENWSLRFAVKGAMRPNTLEFKLVDASGDNVWWYTIPEFTPTRDWQTVVIRQRQVRFAWGPIGGGPPRNIASIEIVVTAGQGGRGTLAIDDLVFTPLPPDVPFSRIAAVRAGLTTASPDAFVATDSNPSTVWTAKLADAPVMSLDFGAVRTYGGIQILWERRPRHVAVDSSNDGTSWHPADSVGVTSANSYIPLPDASSRFVRLRFAGTGDVGVREVNIKPLEFAATPSALLRSIAMHERAGLFPRAFLDQQTYWSVVGVSGGRSEALFSVDGQLELYKRGPSLVPQLLVGDSAITWHDVQSSVSLHDRIRPIPSVQWVASGLQLDITTFAAGTALNSSLYARYRVTNTSTARVQPHLQLSLLPVQVNPPWQFLNTPGGAARVDSLSWNGALVINGTHRVQPLSPPDSVRLYAIIPAPTNATSAPRSTVLRDHRGLAAAHMVYGFDLAPGASQEIVLRMPLDGRGDPMAVSPARRAAVATATTARLAAVARTWSRDQDAVTIELPSSAPEVADALKANLAWILINRDGAGIQPGSRSYERSWIRDGALTAEALLRLGRVAEAKQFAEWYAPFQYESGKVPCCVDARGPDPVDEHDSHGQLIHLVHEVWRYSGDRAFLARMWPHVLRSATFIDSLRTTHRTAAYDTDSLRNFRGLMPASISHEGYSAKPMHSIWDDGFALLGLKEAAAIATTLGRPTDARRIGQWRDEFRSDLLAALSRAMTQHNITYLPGSIELGDFDATSTTTLLSPGGELSNLPRAAVDSTFARYYRAARGRAKPDSLWNDYTPYEWRTVGSLVRLGWKFQALELFTQFMGDRRPLLWHQWAEVVWRDAANPRFIGDMPHTWVGSDFIRSALDLFAYERYEDSALVVGAGVAESWVRDEKGIVVRGLRTPWGPLGFAMSARDSVFTLRFDAGQRVPPGGFVVVPPLEGRVVSVLADGRTINAAPDGTVKLRRPVRVLTITHRLSP